MLFRSNDIVTKIAVTWYQFDFDSDGYEEISDLSAFNNLIRAINIAFVDEHYNGTMVGEGKLLLKEPVTEVTSFEKKWKMHETEEEIKTTPTFETLRIEYYIGGTAVNFVLENK